MGSGQDVFPGDQSTSTEEGTVSGGNEHTNLVRDGIWSGFLATNNPARSILLVVEEWWVDMTWGHFGPVNIGGLIVGKENYITYLRKIYLKNHL